jgi:aminopeptidase
VADSRVARLAEVAVGYSTGVQPGDLVLIDSSSLAAPLVHETVRAVLAAGGNPHARFQLDGALEALLEEGTEEQLRWLSPARAHEIEQANVRIVFESEVNTRSLTGADPARQALVHKARKPLTDRLFERVSAGELRWLVTLYPTPAAAQDAGMSLADYEDFVYRAGFLDEDDPVGLWTAFGERLGRTAEWLSSKRELRIVAEDTDLTLGVDGRTWIPSAGRENFPDGEVFTGPVETSAEGTIRFSYPAQFYGRVVEGVELRFAGGEVVAARAAKGQAFLDEMLALDEGARRVGEFAFGMNEAITGFTLNTLFDEKIGGTVHLALGRSYPVTGGTNVSALHWDMVCDLRDGGQVYADGELVYEDGRFLDA